MPVELVDSHCHLDLIQPREGTLDGVVAAARQQGVGHILCACVTLEGLPAISTHHPARLARSTQLAPEVASDLALLKTLLEKA